MMLETAIRPEEVCRIRRENVHLDQGYLFNPFGKTKAARRKVPLIAKSCALTQNDMRGTRALDAFHAFISQRRQIQTT